MKHKLSLFLLVLCASSLFLVKMQVACIFFVELFAYMRKKL